MKRLKSKKTIWICFSFLYFFNIILYQFLNHNRNKKEHACPYCPKSFNQRVAFNMHVRWVTIKDIYGSYTLNNNKVGRMIIILFIALYSLPLYFPIQKLSFFIHELLFLFKLEYIWVWSLIAVRSVEKHLVGMLMKKLLKWKLLN